MLNSPKFHTALPRLAVLMDPPEEGWHSMDLVGDSLLRILQSHFPDQVSADGICPSIPSRFRRLPFVSHSRTALNTDRLITRFGTYPAKAFLNRNRFDWFHVVDHSYSQLLHVLPRGRSGVYCHDLDTFRCLLSPEQEPRPGWFRAMVRATLTGFQKAAVVFYNSNFVREQILHYRLVKPERLVLAPLGIAPEFRPQSEGPEIPLPPELEKHPFVFHVGSSLPRKRIDFLFSLFAALHAKYPNLRLAQRGAVLTEALQRQIDRLGIRNALVQLPLLNRNELAAFYRKAAVVVVPSQAEGFGLPVIEALACGARVVASDIASLREVGGKAVFYCPVAVQDAWVETVGSLIENSQSGPSLSVRLDQANRFSWFHYGQIILSAYGALEQSDADKRLPQR